MDTEIIKARVKIPDLLARYGIYSGERKRIPCPIHGGDNDSSFSFNDNSFRCFACGASGDVIAFVQQYFNMSFPDAIKQLCSDFALNKPLSLREYYFICEAQKRKTDPIKEELKALYKYAEELETYKRIYKPKFNDESLHPLFADAVNELEHIYEEIYLLEGRQKLNAVKR